MVATLFRIVMFLNSLMTRTSIKTFVCSWRNGEISFIFSINSEAFISELLQIFYKMISQYTHHDSWSKVVSLKGYHWSGLVFSIFWPLLFIFYFLHPFLFCFISVLLSSLSLYIYFLCTNSLYFYVYLLLTVLGSKVLQL